MADFSWVPKELEGLVSYQNGRLVVSCATCGVPRQTSGKSAVLRRVSEGKIVNLKYCGIHGSYRGMKFPQSDIDSWPDGHKRCTDCKEIKPFSEYHKHATAMFGYNTVCKPCRLPLSKRHWAEKTYEKKMFERAKERANRFGREFDIELSDIVIPERCPIFNVPFIQESNHDYSPSLDRIDSSRGYTKDNIMVVSRRANVLKNNMTLQECEMILDHLKRLTDTDSEDIIEA